MIRNWSITIRTAYSNLIPELGSDKSLTFHLKELWLKWNIVFFIICWTQNVYTHTQSQFNPFLWTRLNTKQNLLRIFYAFVISHIRHRNVSSITGTFYILPCHPQCINVIISSRSLILDIWLHFRILSLSFIFSMLIP